MRVAYVMNSVEGGGGTFPVPDICRCIQRGGAEVRVFALTPRDRLAEPRILDAGFACRVREGGQKDHRAAYQWLIEELTAWKPTHLWTSLSRSTIIGMAVARKLRVPQICWQHAAHLKPKYYWTLRLLRERIALWVADSQSVADYAQGKLQVRPERLISWPIFSVPPNTPQAQPWQAGQTIEVGSVGRLHKVKGYDTLIGVLYRLKKDGFAFPAPLRLRIGGSGREQHALMAQIRDLNMPNVELTGFVHQPLEFMASLHLYAQPSIWEGFCVAAHEAMAAGVPVVGTRVGEMAKSIEDGVTGYSFLPKDVAGLALAMHRALQAPDRLAVMGDAARHLVNQRFSQKNFEDTGAKIMRRLAAMTV